MSLPLSLLSSFLVRRGGSVVSSLDDDVEEFVPVGWLETTETHSESTDLLDQSAFEVELLHFLFVLLAQLHLDEAPLHQVVEFIATELLTASFVDRFALLYDFSLFRIAVNHIGVEETTDFFVVIFYAL